MTIAKSVVAILLKDIQLKSSSASIYRNQSFCNLSSVGTRTEKCH